MGRSSKLRQWDSVYSENTQTRDSAFACQTKTSLLLILYGLGQIPLAQGQILGKDETTETTQNWNSQESGAGTEGSVRETQDNPALTHSGIVKKEERRVLYAEIPLQNRVNEQIMFSVMSGNQSLGALTFHRMFELAWRNSQCKVYRSCSENLNIVQKFIYFSN